MPSFGKSSKDRLITCHPILQELMWRTVEERDCSITCGHRNEVDQNQVYEKRLSRVRWPNSKHNSLPSMAVDVVPWPEKWESESAFLDLYEVIRDSWASMVAENLTEDYCLRWGGDWDGDGDRKDQTFDDLPHWELVK